MVGPFKRLEIPKINFGSLSPRNHSLETKFRLVGYRLELPFVRSAPPTPTKKTSQKGGFFMVGPERLELPTYPL